MSARTTVWAAALALAASGCDTQGGSGEAAKYTLVNAPRQELPPAAASLGDVSRASAADAPAAPAPTAEAEVQAGRRAFDGDTRDLGDHEADPVEGRGSGWKYVEYTDPPRPDTLIVNEPPVPGQPPKKASLEAKGWVWPVPDNAKGETAEISSGRHMRAGEDGKMGTPDDYLHRGVDIMYRADKKGRKCGKRDLPWTDGCYMMAPDTPALAVNHGVVLQSADVDTGGRVLIDHGGGVRTAYVHLSKRLVKKGDKVAPGQPVGIIGGNPKGYNLAHLHFDLLIDGKYVDPAPYLKKWSHPSPSVGLVASSRP